MVLHHIQHIIDLFTNIKKKNLNQQTHYNIYSLFFYNIILC